MRYPAALLALALVSLAATAQPVTYQGVLNDNAAPANAEYDLLFRLYLDPGGATQVGGDVQAFSHPVLNGLLNIQLDFGPGAFDPALNAGQRFLEVQISPPEVGNYEKILPLQPITPAPLAIRALEELWSHDPLADIYSTGDGDSLLAFNTPAPLIPETYFNLHTPDTTTVQGLGVSTDNPQGSPAYFYQNGRATTHTRLDGLANTWTVRHNNLDTLNVAASGRVGIGTQAPATELDVGGVVTAAGFAYSSFQPRDYAISGVDFQPLSSDVRWIVRPSGAYYRDPDADSSFEMYAPVHLPDEARITTFAAYFYDNSGGVMVFSLYYKPHLSQTPVQLATLTSSGAQATIRGLLSNLATPHIVDNEANAYYVLAAAGDWDDSATRVTGARIRYTLTSP